MDKPRIGFIGAGLMGHGIAKNLVIKGYPLTVRANRNRAPVEDLVSKGAKEAKTNADVARDVCMHIAAMNPAAVSIEDLDPEVVAKERDILSEAARKEGKPENIIEKMIEGRMRNFYAERVLNEQPFVKDDKQTVGKYAAAGGIKVKSFHYWQLGK